MHENAPCGAGAFKKISDDDQKIYSKNFYFLTQRRKDAEIKFEHGKHGINGKINAR